MHRNKKKTPQNRALNKQIGHLDKHSKKMLRKSVSELPLDSFYGPNLDRKRTAIEKHKSHLRSVQSSLDKEYLEHREDDIEKIEDRIENAETVNELGHKINNFIFNHNLSVNIGGPILSITITPEPSERNTQCKALPDNERTTIEL